MQFRKDINGVRAIAVIAVVLFHFNSSWLLGGFAGVDIFFVISGFLMTRIIFERLEQKNFSIIAFYLSRSHRIIPALAVLCFTILILGYLFLTAFDYKIIGRDVVTSMFFVSNIMFSLKGDYFDTGDNFLLHTWSLSTEWQFYLIYPLILVAMRKFMSIRAMKVSVLFGTFLGFIFCVVATNQWPFASYYLLPMRMWEMILGGVAYLYPFTLQDNRKKILQWGGILLIICSYFFISKDVAWPGYLSVFPVLGTFLIIQAQYSNSVITGNVIFQKIGVWSYSIYLWHWPIALSFSYYNIDSSYIVLGILASVLLGGLSYFFIEKKFFLSSKTNVINYVLIILFFGAAGSVIFVTQGIANRGGLVSNSLIHGGTTDDYLMPEGVSLINTEFAYDYLLLGDSHANHYNRGIKREGTKVKKSWYSACLSFPHAISATPGVRVKVTDSWKKSCSNNYKLALNEKVPIIIAQSWFKPAKNALACINDHCDLSGNYYVDLRSQLSELLATYESNDKVYIIGELPKALHNEIMICLRTNHLLGLNLTCDEKGKPKAFVSKINNILRDVVSNYDNAIFIDPGNALCKKDSCVYNLNGQSIFMTDASHLSGYGSEYIWSYIIRHIEGKM